MGGESERLTAGVSVSGPRPRWWQNASRTGLAWSRAPGLSNPASPGWRSLVLGRPWWTLPCAGAAIALLWVPFWTNPFTDVNAATFQLAIYSLIVAGWISFGRVSQRANGALMMILALLVSAVSLQDVEQGPWAFIGTMDYPVTGIVLGVLILRWPRARLQTRAQRSWSRSPS